jgi:sigma-E factor negative regulatory protein RseB
VIRHPRTTFATGTITALILLVTGGALTTVAYADDGRSDNDAAAPAASDPRAVLFLIGAVRAERTRSYWGTEYVCAWTQGSQATSVVEVQHSAGTGTLVRVQPSVAAPGGELQEPEQADQPAPIDPLAVSAVEGGPLDLLRRNYVLSLAAPDATTAEVQARRRDGTMAATFWIDKRTGLALRREVFDSAGRLVRASAFVELHLGGVMPAANTPMPSVATAARETPLDGAQVAQLRQVGWLLPTQLPGGMVLYDVRSQGTDADTIVHLSYSDGLSTVSVFVQRGRLATHALSGWSQARMGGTVYVHDYGLGRRVTWNGHGRVYTVVADAPPTAVAALVASLPHGEHHRGLFARLRHGLARVGSWLNPFS